jgi:hypothetical protein
MIHQIKQFLESRVYSYETSDNKKILDVEPTNITDVFNVYDDYKKILLMQTNNELY